MNIYEVSRRYRISLMRLQALERDGLIEFDAPDPVLEPIRHSLAHRQVLPAPQMVVLVEQPELLSSLGKHETRARELLKCIGSPVHPAPPDVAGEISAAASNESFAVKRIVAWCKNVLPDDREVTHHFLAVRLLLGVQVNLRQYEAKRLRRVMLSVRKHPDFAGWWRIEPQGRNNVTFYRKPVNFDL